jgi:hypothetical protein
MCNKKRLGQTAARLLVGMAVGLAGGAFAENSIVPVNWNVPTITDGAYLQTFENALTWGGQTVGTATTNSRVTVAPPSRSNAWFSAGTTLAMKIPDDASYTNTLVNDGVGGAVSFATTPVFVDMRIQFTAYEGTPPDNAKLAVFVSTTNLIHVVHNGGTTTNTWPGGDLLSAWHQLTVRLQKDGKCAVLLDDVTVTNNLTPKVGVGTVNELDSLEFANSGYVDDLYVSHGNPNYPGTMGTIPAGAGVPSVTAGSVTNWLANYFNDGRLAANANLTGILLDRAYLLNMAPTNGEPVTSVAFGVSAIDLVSPTLVKVTCRLTVNGSNREDPINGKLQLQGKTAIGNAYATLDGAVSPQSTDFNGGLATYTFTVPSGMKFFKAQIVE